MNKLLVGSRLRILGSDQIIDFRIQTKSFCAMMSDLRYQPGQRISSLENRLRTMQLSVSARKRHDYLMDPQNLDLSHFSSFFLPLASTYRRVNKQ